MTDKSSRNVDNDMAIGSTPRSSSVASDVRSISGKSAGGSSPPHANPPPQYIGEAAASQLVSAELECPVEISHSALELVNGFLDQILYTILTKAQSTSLSSLRAAVPLVLKQRLGSAALKVADEEVIDYMDEEDQEELLTGNGIIEPTADFQLDLAWKLARLRCMVYARLGDMEEESEEEFLEEEGLQRYLDDPNLNAAPAAAIFLSTILEFLGEQTLCVAGQHAERRHNMAISKKINGHSRNQSSEVHEIIIDRSDMIAVGRDGALSKLWRSWRRDTRSSEPLSPRPITPNTMHPPSFESPMTNQKANLTSPIAAIPEERSSQSSPTKTEPISSPSQIPLPMTNRDIDEIEVPGLAREVLDDGEQPTMISVPPRSPRRPQSMVFVPGSFPVAESPVVPDGRFPDETSQRPKGTRLRSQSVPTRNQLTSNPSQYNQNSDDGLHTKEAENDSIHQKSLADTNEDLSSKEQNFTSDNQTKRSFAPSSIISGTVAALAGALGVEAMRARGQKESPSTESNRASSVPRSNQSKEMRADRSVPTSDAQQQNIDTESVSDVRDFEGVDVPTKQHSRNVGNSTHYPADGSDPEDLALSSADEDGTEHGHRHGLRDSGLGVVTPNIAQTANRAGNVAIVNHGPQSTQSRQDMQSTNRGGPLENATPNDKHLNVNKNEQAAEAESPETVYEDAGTRLSNDSTNDAIKQSLPSATTTSSWPAVVPPRRSSIEQPGATNPPTEARLSHMSHASQSSTSTNGRYPGYSREPQPRPQSLNTQRSVPPEVASNTRTIHSRASSTARDQRPGTSGSNSTTRRQYPRLYADSEELARGISPADYTDEAKKKSLEILIRSDETLHYTLTPEQARAGTVEYHRPSSRQKTQTQELAEFLRNTAPPGEDSTRPRTSRSTKESIGGNRTSQSNVTTAPVVYPEHKVVIPKSSVAAPISSPTKSKNPLGEPRDARAERNTTRDLADYARSTGPATETQLPKSLGSRPGSPEMTRNAQSSIRTDTGPVVVPERTPMDSVQSSKKSESPANRLKFQARDARPSKESNSDLIDFIREGPPRTAGDHRIDRNVAPFRTTMDSEELNSLAPPQDLENRNSVGSVGESLVTGKSLHSSMNSRTGLLDSNNRSAPRTSNGTNVVSNGVTRQPIIHEAENGIPKQHRRKVRDPYAIDDSDDDLLDEDEEFGEQLINPKPKSREETLIDFLRNTAPEPGMTTQPILAAGSRKAKELEHKQTPSRSKYQDVLGSESNYTDKQNSNSSQPPRPTTPPPKPRSTGAVRETSPHLTQVGSKYDKYRPTQSTHAPHVERNRQQKPKYEPRDPSNRTNGRATAELAEYLRTSGPSSGQQQQNNNNSHSTTPSALPPYQEREENQHERMGGQSGNVPMMKDQAGFMKFFARKGSIRK